MRNLVAAVVVLMLLASVASAAQPVGQVSDQTLAKLGLSQMSRMTDVQGMSVRGAGFASVSGQSWAWAPGSGTSQKYCATSITCNALAAGGSVSVAAAGIGVFTPCGNFGAVVGSVAGGAAVAYAK
jgi:hypothetical protein